MITKPRNAPFDATIQYAPGLTTVGVQIIDYPDVIVPRTGVVSEIAPGIYQASLTAPTTAGDYTILWDDGDGDSGANWKWEDLRVTASLLVATEEDEDPSYLTEGEAAARIQRMCLASEDPVLDEDEIADLVSAACRPDADGFTRADTEWTPTWDLNAGAAEGWARKAAKAANRFNFAEDGQRFDRAQVYQHCEAQRLVYANKSMGSIPVSRF